MVTFQLLLVGHDSSSLIAYANTALQKTPSPSCKDRTIIFSFFWNFSVAIESDDANPKASGQLINLRKGTNMSKTKPTSLTTPKVASRVQRANALTNDGTVKSGNVVGRMQRAAVKNFGKPGSK